MARFCARLVGHLFSRLLRRNKYNDRLGAATPLMDTALRWLATHMPGSAEPLHLMDAIPCPVPSPSSPPAALTLFEYAGYGYCPSHSRWYWGAKLMLIVTCDGSVTGFGLANPG